MYQYYQRALMKEKTGAVCGIDLGLKDFAITSDGIKFKNNKYTKQYEKELAKAQKHLSWNTKAVIRLKDKDENSKTSREYNQLTNG